MAHLGQGYVRLSLDQIGCPLRIHHHLAAEHEETLARLRSEWGQALEQADSPLFGSSLALHYGIEYERAYVAWCQWVVQELEQRTPPNA